MPLLPRIRQHPQQPIVDHNCTADDVGQAVRQREQIGGTAAGLCLAALHYQPVDNGRDFTPGHLLVDNHDRESLGGTLESHLLAVAAQ